MNRLTESSIPKVMGIAVGALFLLVPTTELSAQLAMPGTSNAAAQAQPATTTSALDAGQQWLQHARAAMEKKDFQTAVNSYRQAAAIAPHAQQVAAGVAKLRLDLQIAGIDSQLLAAPAKAAPPSYAQKTTGLKAMPEPNAQPLTPASKASPKQQALQLMAIGKAALDRGDAATAVAYARKAQSLNVPESEFQPGEPRVWQFVLDAESAARRGGVVQASATSPVQQAGAPANQGAIAQVPFTSDGAHAGDIRQVQAQDLNVQVVEDEIPVLGGAPSGTDLYTAGMEALRAGNKELARKKFVEAWRYESQLPLDVRRQLKDKLTLLQPIRLPSANTPTDLADLTPMEKAELASREEVGRVYREITTELAKAAETNKTAPLDALDELNRLRRSVEGANVDETSKRGLLAQVDRALTEQKKYVEANRNKIELDLENESVKTQIQQDRIKEDAIDEEISSLVEQFNDLMDGHQFEEAEVIAKSVQELKPGSTIATSMVHMSRMGTRRLIHEEISAGKEQTFMNQMTDIENDSIYNPNLPYEMPRDWADMSRRRLARTDENLRMSPAEREINSKLETAAVNVKYNNRPLHEVLAEISAVADVPIVTDNRALSAIRVTPDAPISLEITKAIPLGKALNLILRDLELTYVIDNDVLNITSVEAKRADVEPRTYRVADLVTPIPNFTSSYDAGLAGALRAAYQMTQPRTDVQIMPVSVADIHRGQASNNGMANPNMLGQYNPMGAQSGFGPSASPLAGRGGGSFADFQSLINLIQTTVVPDTWEALGGPSTMAEYPQNLSLVISTTSDVHDQIADLLESLRALQNLQITIEVRFITLSDTFFEQIGVDFDVQFDDNVQTLPDDDSGPGVTIGFDGIAGLPTPDLDITFNNNSFGVTPAFGAPDAGAISSIGFAILSDIEAFFFLQAAQGDNRNNVMQAPKVTLFDGQFASIQDQTSRPFVTSITPVVGDFAVAQQPVIVVLNEGTQLNVQGIVSDDKRFVRLTLVPFFSQIGDVDTFTFEGRRSTNSTSRDENGDTNGDGVVDDNDAVDETAQNDVIEGTTVQLPTFAFTTVQTTVSVPDGGTILLGGIKRLAEGRSERGVPFLSKVPYVSRLFRNTAIGRDARSLMMMVTPRIIIQEEEEEAQTGFIPNR